MKLEKKKLEECHGNTYSYITFHSGCHWFTHNLAETTMDRDSRARGPASASASEEIRPLVGLLGHESCHIFMVSWFMPVIDSYYSYLVSLFFLFKIFLLSNSDSDNWTMLYSKMEKIIVSSNKKKEKRKLTVWGCCVMYDVWKKGSVQNLMFRFTLTPNPNLHWGSCSTIWLNQNLKHYVRFGFEHCYKCSEPNRGQSNLKRKEKIEGWLFAFE